MRRAVAIALIASSGGCLAIHEHTRVDDVTLRTFDVTGPVVRERPHGTVEATANELVVHAEVDRTCAQLHRRHVKRWQVTERTGSTAMHVLEYATGALFAAAGGYVLYDNRSGRAPEERTFAIGTTNSAGRAAGAGAAGVGGLLLLAGGIDSIRKRQSRDELSEVDVDDRNDHATIACGTKPASGIEVGLMVTTPDEPQGTYVPAGSADGTGALRVAWATLTFPPKTQGSARLVLGVERVDIAGVTVPDGLRRDPEDAWRAAVAVDTAAAYRSYLAIASSSDHTEEANTRKRAAVTRELQAEIAAAVDASALDRAETALAGLRVEGDPAVVPGAEAKVGALRTKVRVAELQRRLTDAVAGIDEKPSPAALVTLTSTVDELERVDAGEGARARALATATRDRVATRLLAEAQVAANQDDLATMSTKIDVAGQLSTDAKAYGKKRDAILRPAIATRRARARQLAAQHSYDDAIALLEPLVALAPTDASLAAETARWKRAEDDLERSDRIARDRAEAARAARADRDAAAKAERERAATAAQAERERIAAEKSLAEEKRARDEADRQAKIVVAKAEIERRAKELEDKRRADDRARQQKALDDADRKLAEQQAALARKRAALAEQQSPSYQLELATQFDGVRILEQVPIRPGCSAVYGAFRRAPTDCTGHCESRVMTKLDLTCAGSRVSLVQDGARVSVSCDAQQDCASCLVAGQSALATFMRGDKPSPRSCAKRP